MFSNTMSIPSDLGSEMNYFDVCAWSAYDTFYLSLAIIFLCWEINLNKNWNKLVYNIW